MSLPLSTSMSLPITLSIHPSRPCLSTREALDCPTSTNATRGLSAFAGDCDGSRCGGNRNTCDGYQGPRSSCSDTSFVPRPPYDEYEVFGVNSTVVMRQPSMPIDEVPSVYTCPTPQYNPLCLRLGLMPLWELERAHDAAAEQVEAPLTPPTPTAIRVSPLAGSELLIA